MRFTDEDAEVSPGTSVLSGCFSEASLVAGVVAAGLAAVADGWAAGFGVVFTACE